MAFIIPFESSTSAEAPGLQRTGVRACFFNIFPLVFRQPTLTLADSSYVVCPSCSSLSALSQINILFCRPACTMYWYIQDRSFFTHIADDNSAMSYHYPVALPMSPTLKITSRKWVPYFPDENNRPILFGGPAFAMLNQFFSLGLLRRLWKVSS